MSTYRFDATKRLLLLLSHGNIRGLECFSMTVKLTNADQSISSTINMASARVSYVLVPTNALR